ncbi:MAG TPA: hypothetical protein VMF58_05190, partial [Rhizomicrobium sp.]|nr:hypothetical protein [Rhizomicrobium sp.]
MSDLVKRLTIPAIVVASFFVLWDTWAIAQQASTIMGDDKQWVMPAKNYANTRFSGLKQITPENAGQLKVAWTFSVGSNHGQEAAPIVIGDTMYVVGA